MIVTLLTDFGLADHYVGVMKGVVLGVDARIRVVDLTGVPFSLRIVRLLGEAAAANGDFVKARAVVGLPDAARPTVGAVADFSGRPLEVFPDTETALEWLSEQPAPLIHH